MAVKKLFSITGVFDKPEKILETAKKVVDAGYRNFDIHAPYNLKGLDEAMSLKQNRSNYLVFIFAFLGGLAAFLFMCWTTSVDYPQIIGGKNYLAFTGYIPITFEITVLTAAIFAFIILIIFLARLPDNSYPLHDTDYLRKVSENKFGISIEKKDPIFDEIKIREFLMECGAADITAIYYEEPEQKYVKIFLAPKFLGFLAFTIIATFLITTNTFNRILEQRPFTNLDQQAKLLPQQDIGIETFSQLKPPEGSVPRGFINDKFTDNPDEGAKYLVNPLISTKDILEKGKTNFNAYCSACHGFSARGTDSRLKGLFPTPPSLLTLEATNWKDGRIYQIITHGQMIMPSYASQIDPEDRWTIILYLRALQQAQKNGELATK